MTEREFLENLGASFGPTGRDESIMLNRWRLKALNMAKAQGAKFDPGSEDLPKLPKLVIVNRVYGSVIELSELRSLPEIFPPGSNTYMLSREQAEEVIRRCEVLLMLKRYLLAHGVIDQEILDLIDGKSNVICQTHQE